MKIREKEKQDEQEQNLCEIIIDKIFQFLLIFIFGLACGYCWCWNALGQKIGG